MVPPPLHGEAGRIMTAVSEGESNYTKRESHYLSKKRTKISFLFLKKKYIKCQKKKKKEKEKLILSGVKKA